MKPKTTGQCALCLALNVTFVKSHIIPKSFYEEFGKGNEMKILSDSSGTHERSTKIGLHSRFICEPCERKFNDFDEPASHLIKQHKYSTKVFEHTKADMWIIENAFSHKDIFAKFALSILWRAKASGDTVYESVNLGPYQEPIRLALLNNNLDENLLFKTSLHIRLFKKHNSNGGINAAFEPYINKSTRSMKQNFGNFKYHSLGFPWGEIVVKVGGEGPINQGYLTLDDSFKLNKDNKSCVLWTSNLSTDYPHLAIVEYDSRSIRNMDKP